MDNLLEVRNMKVSFVSRQGSVQAIRGTSFAVREGEVFAIVGESGSGKSVLTQSCLRLLPSPPARLDGGEVIFNGQDLLTLHDRELQRIRGKDIAVIFQDAMTALNPTMRIGQQITEMILEHARLTPAEASQKADALLAGPLDETAKERWLLDVLRSLPEQLEQDKKALNQLLQTKKTRKEIAAWVMDQCSVTKERAVMRAIELLRMVRIPDPERHMDQYIFQCSGGMRQRVMIAMALSCRPRLVIADEPTTALDVTIKTEVLDLLTSLIRELGSSIILITHDLGMVASYADRIGVMYAGRFVEQGTCHDIFYRTGHPYTRGLMQAVPRLDLPHNQELVTIAGTPPSLNRMPGGCAFAPRCPYAMEICHQRAPETTGLSSGHTADCWLYDSRAERMRKQFTLEGGGPDA